MQQNLHDFAYDENGAITIDWVVLTAAIAVLALILVPLISPQVRNTASAIAANVQAAGDNLQNLNTNGEDSGHASPDPGGS